VTRAPLPADASAAPASVGPLDSPDAGGAPARAPTAASAPVALDLWPLPALVVEIGAEESGGSDRVVAENAAATALLGPRRASDRDRAAGGIVVEADRHALIAALRARDASDGPTAPLLLRVQGAGGTVPVNLHRLELPPMDGGSARVLAVLVPTRSGPEAEQAVAAADARWRDVTHQLQDVREQEQKRIARELHDQLGADLSLLRVELARIAPKLRWARRGVRETVERMRDHAGELLETVRRIARELRPRVLDHVGEVGLAAVLEYVAADVHRSTGLVVHLDTHVEDGAVDARRAEAAYHVVREALHNVVRHASATRAVVSARVEGAVLVLDVLDDGRGAGPESGAAVTPESEGIGWWSLRERVRAFGGDVSVRAEPGVGTTVTARIPLESAGL
jgi:signal transduction histidine kinase